MFLILNIFPLTIILIVIWAITRKKIVGKILGYFWLGLFGLFCLGVVIKLLTDQIVIDKVYYYGEYIVNRDYLHVCQYDLE